MKEAITCDFGGTRGEISKLVSTASGYLRAVNATSEPKRKVALTLRFTANAISGFDDEDEVIRNLREVRTKICQLLAEYSANYILLIYVMSFLACYARYLD
jgi:hypothetical protein